jgi:hypothetical protein
MLIQFIDANKKEGEGSLGYQAWPCGPPAVDHEVRMDGEAFVVVRVAWVTGHGHREAASAVMQQSNAFMVIAVVYLRRVK